MSPRRGSVPGDVLVVGGAGFVGSHIVDRLLSDGSRVDVVDDLSTGSLSNLARARSSAVEGALRIHTLDATIPEFVDVVRLRRPQVVYVTSLLSSVIDSTNSNSNECVESFATAVAVLDAAVRAEVAKVVITLPAIALYGEVPARELPIKEDREKKPTDSAGVTAMAIIELCELYRRNHDLEFTVLAMSDVYGPRQRSDNNMVSALLAAKLSGTQPSIQGDGKQTRDFLYIDDAVDAASRAGSKGGGLVLHIGTGQQTSINDLWALIGEGQPATFVAKPARSLMRFALSSSRARLHLGWVPWTKLAEGIGHSSAW